MERFRTTQDLKHLVDAIPETVNLRDLYPHPQDRPLVGQPLPGNPLHPRMYVCEFFATMLLLVFGIASNVAIGSPLNPLGRYLAREPALLSALEGFLFGFSSTLAAFSPFGRVSGAHLSPSVSLAFLIGRRLAWIDAAFYVAVQLGGAVAGTGLIALSGWLWPRWGAWCHADFFAATMPNPLTPLWWAAAGRR